jgi:hypothetical protein
LPIARFGQIARMNDELVASEGPGGLVSKLDVIMVEARSWGGHSGSPAFVLFSATRHPGVITLPGIPTSDTRAFWALLGLVSGHWELPVAVRERNAPKLPTPHSVAINAGIALVAPAQQIVDLLMRDDVVADRLAREQAHRDSEANLERLRSPMGGPTSRKRTKNRPVTFPHTD